MTHLRCADASLAAGEALGGTGVVANRIVCVESRTPWGRDALSSGFPPDVSARLAELDATVFAIRRPGRRVDLTVFVADVTEAACRLRRFTLDTVDDVLELDLDSAGDAVGAADGEPVDEPVFLVCTHGRRDACCARLGVPVFTTLDRVVGDARRVWQCSHTGGHRFAANVIALPLGLTLGRITPGAAAEVAACVEQSRIPLRGYRGRCAYSAPVQAAEVALRRAHGLDHCDDLRLVARPAGSDPELVAFATPDGRRLSASVRTTTGPILAKSCGADVEQLETFAVEVQPG